MNKKFYVGETYKKSIIYNKNKITLKIEIVSIDESRESLKFKPINTEQAGRVFDGKLFTFGFNDEYFVSLYPWKDITVYAKKGE